MRHPPPVATPVSLSGISPVRARREEHEHAELLVPLDLAGEARARHDLRTATASPRSARAEPSGTSATPIRFFSRSMLRISNGAGHARRRPALASRPRVPVGGNVDACASAFDARLELDERAELGDARDAARRTWPTS